MIDPHSDFEELTTPAKLSNFGELTTPPLDQAVLENICRQLLTAIGEDPNRSGLLDTPRRFARHWLEFINHDAGNIGTTFEVIEADQLVVVNGIRVWSMCEHHLLPFYCDIAIGYLATDRVLGLSKFARIANKYAHRLQIQERLVKQIADDVAQLTASPDVAVIAAGEHLCATMRGARTPMTMKSSVMRGQFRSSSLLRQEFLGVVNLDGRHK